MISLFMMMMTIADWSLAVVGIGEPWVGRSGGGSKKDATNQHCRENIKNNVQKKTYDFGKL